MLIYLTEYENHQGVILLTMINLNFDTYLGDVKEYSNPHEKYLDEVLHFDQRDEYSVKLRNYQLALDDNRRHAITISCNECGKAFFREEEDLSRQDLRSGLWMAHDLGNWYEVSHGIYIEVKDGNAEFYDCICSECFDRIQTRQNSDQRYMDFINGINEFYQELDNLIAVIIPKLYHSYYDLFSEEDAQALNPNEYEKVKSEEDWYNYLDKFEGKVVAQMEGYVRSNSRLEYAGLNDKVGRLKKMIRLLDQPYLGVYELFDESENVNLLRIKETEFMPFKYFHSMGNLRELIFESNNKLRNRVLRKLRKKWSIINTE